MNEDHSTKKYRGFKYFVIALLFFGVLGIYYFTKDRTQTENTVANLKDKVSSTIETTGEQGKKLMSKATEAKDEIQDKVVQGAEKAANYGSDAVDKAKELAGSAKEKGSQWAGQVNTPTGMGGGTSESVTSSDKIEAMTSDTVGDAKTEMANRFDKASDTVSSRIEGVKESMDEKAEDVTASAPSMSDGDTSGSDASKALNTAASQSGIADTDSVMGSSEPGKMNLPVIGEDREAGDRVKERMASATSSTNSASMDKDSTSDQFPGKRWQQNISEEAQSAAYETSGQKTSGQKTSGAATARRCVGEPPRGKDMGDRYIVAYCETLGIISERTGVKVRDLINRNPEVENPNLIYPDQSLRLPPRG